MSRISGIIFNIAHYTIHDGPGIRTTVFFKGCPMRCMWCCSPGSQSSEREITWNSSLCSSCGRCFRICGYGAVSAENNAVLGIDRSRCIRCGQCSEVCPTGAIEVIGRSYTAEGLFTEVRRDEPFWRRSGGGVTLSGGEVMAQPDFAECFLDLCRKHFVHTAIETCLSAPLDTVMRIADKTDFIHFDLKVMDPDMHLKLTGLDNGDILENAAYLLESAKSLLVRFPMIPGLNDGLDNIESLGRFLAAHRKGVTLEILPYHRMGAGRYGLLGRKYMLQDIIPPEEGRMLRVAEILSRYPIKVIRP